MVMLIAGFERWKGNAQNDSAINESKEQMKLIRNTLSFFVSRQLPKRSALDVLDATTFDFIRQ